MRVFAFCLGLVGGEWLDLPFELTYSPLALTTYDRSSAVNKRGKTCRSFSGLCSLVSSSL
jgi:hypothetical protein